MPFRHVAGAKLSTNDYANNAAIGVTDSLADSAAVHATILAANAQADSATVWCPFSDSDQSSIGLADHANADAECSAQSCSNCRAH